MRLSAFRSGRPIFGGEFNALDDAFLTAIPLSDALPACGRRPHEGRATPWNSDVFAIGSAEDLPYQAALLIQD